MINLIDARLRLLNRLFSRCYQQGKWVYRLKDETKRELAEVTWRDHGVCLSCNHRAITCGQCAQCGAKPKGA